MSDKPSFPHVTASSSARPWLVVDGVRLREGAGGAVYRATGYNCYVMVPGGEAPARTMNQADIDDYFASLRPNSLSRIWTPAPDTGATGQTWDQQLALIDHIVASAKANDQRLILSLTSWGGNQANADAFCTPAKDMTWITGLKYTAAVYGANSFEAWVKALAARYAAESTVSGYDVMNEPQDAGAANTAALVTYVRTVKGWIKALAPNALVYFGVSTSSNVGGLAAYQTLMAECDVCSFHPYSTQGFLSTSQASLFPAIRALGKPLLVDEFGAWAKATYGLAADGDTDTNDLPAMTFAAQAQMVRAYLDSFFSIPEVAAAIVWDHQKDTDTWWTGTGMYSLLKQAPAREVLRTHSLAGLGFNEDVFGATVEGWVDSAQALRAAPGSAIGGSTGTNQHIYDRVAVAERNQTNAALAPIAQNGKVPGGWPSIYFDGTRYIASGFWHTGGSATRQHTKHFVIVPDALPAAASYHYLLAPNSSGIGLAIRINAAGNVELVRYDTLVVLATGNVPVVPGQLNKVTVEWDSAGGAYRILVNGQIAASGSSVVAITTTKGGTLGAAHDGTSGFLGHLLELVFTVAVDQGKTGLTLAYLDRKYGSAGKDPR